MWRLDSGKKSKPEHSIRHPIHLAFLGVLVVLVSHDDILFFWLSRFSHMKTRSDHFALLFSVESSDKTKQLQRSRAPLLIVLIRILKCQIFLLPFYNKVRLLQISKVIWCYLIFPFIYLIHQWPSCWLLLVAFAWYLFYEPIYNKRTMHKWNDSARPLVWKLCTPRQHASTTPTHWPRPYHYTERLT